MATATLTFDLNNIDDRFDHLRAVRSADLAVVLFQIINNGKKAIENKMELVDDLGPYDTLDLVYEYISEVLNEYGVDIDKFIQ